MRQTKFQKIAFVFLLLAFVFSISAQTKRKSNKNKTIKKITPAETIVEKKEPAPETTPTPEIKKNSRPETENSPTTTEKTSETAKTNARPNSAATQNKPVYFYEFSQPDFIISKINIEHDENGKGKITFEKKNFSEPETDPIQLSSATLERLKNIWQALNFLDSTENYQTVRDFSNLGTMKFTVKKDGRERTASFNWTENKDAKALADEYRKIGQQFLWIFDITVAQENQPLEAPKLMESLDSLIRRNEISDPAQMIPLLKELGNNERIPLIARNRAAKIVEKLEKSAKK